MSSRLGRAAQALLAVSVVVFASIAFWRNWSDFRTTDFAWRLRLDLLLLSALITWAMYAALILAWRSFLTGWGQRLSAWQAARIWTVSSLGKYVPGKVWSVAGMAVLAQRAGVAPWIATASAVMLQALAVGTGVLTVSLTGTSILEDRYPWIRFALWTLGILSAAAVALALSPRFTQLLLSRLSGAPSLPNPPLRVALLAVIVNLLAWCGYGVAFWVMTRGLLSETSLTVPQAIGAFTASYLAGLLALFAPGGIVVREAVFILMLQGSLGLATASALAVASRLLLSLTELGAALPFLVLPRERPRVAL